MTVTVAQSNLVTEWRQAVMAQLDENLQDGAFREKVIPGERDGVSRENIACVFAPPMRTDGGNVSFARPVLIVRAWIGRPKTPATQQPRDPQPVEQLMLDLASCLQSMQALELPSAIFGLYFFVTEIAPDYDDWGVQATLEAWTGNPAVVAFPETS